MSIQVCSHCYNKVHECSLYGCKGNLLSSLRGGKKIKYSGIFFGCKFFERAGVNSNAWFQKID